MTEFVAGFHIEKRKYFCWDLLYVSIKCRRTAPYLKQSKNLFYPQIKILQRFSKNTCMSHGVFVSGFYIEKGKYFCLDLHYVPKVETGRRHT